MDSVSQQEQMTEQYISLITSSAVPNTMTITEIMDATNVTGHCKVYVQPLDLTSGTVMRSNHSDGLETSLI